MDQLLCPWESPKWILFSSNVPFLLPYSHFVALLSAILSFIFIFRSRQNIFSRIFLFVTILFSLWVLMDWYIWATNKSHIVMFLWSLQILVELFIYSASIYLVYVFIYKKRPNFKYEIIGSIILLPVILLLPTNFVLNGIDLSYCNASEHSFVVFYSYIFETISIIIIIHAIIKSLIIENKIEKITRLLFGFGIITFLLAFTSGNIIGSVTENWEYAQFGLFGMPLFMGILSYSIMRYNAFNTKTFSAQILVSILMLLTSGILFLRTIERVRIITFITLFLISILGIFLVRSVKHEVEQREKIEKLAKELGEANDKLRGLDQMKSEFLSLATHQIRSPLTAIKGYSSMLLEGDFGALPNKAAESVEIIFKASQNLIKIVGDFLDISRIEQGRMVYEKSVFDFGILVKEVVSELQPNIQNAGLSLNLDIKEGLITPVNADKNKIKQVISNIIDNAVKYTVRGGINIAVSNNHNKVWVTIKDTGVGIDPSEMGKLFSKFSRTKDAGITNVTGTGLGLYIAKKMIEAHHGEIKVSSEGVGKGSTFIIELPRYK